MRKGNNSRYFRFENHGSVKRFIQLYNDLFVPYSVHNEHYGEMDDNIKQMLGQGYCINGTNVKVNIFPEGLEEILKSGCFKKEKVRRNVYEYVFKG